MRVESSNLQLPFCKESGSFSKHSGLRLRRLSGVKSHHPNVNAGLEKSHITGKKSHHNIDFSMEMLVARGTRAPFWVKILKTHHFVLCPPKKTMVDNVFQPIFHMGYPIDRRSFNEVWEQLKTPILNVLSNSNST